MPSNTQFLQRLCQISLLIFACFNTRVNAENIPNLSWIANNNVTQSNLKASTNKIDFGSVFKQMGVEGSVVIYDLSNKKFYEHNSSRNKRAFVPASTFKILNTLIALETGAISDDRTVIKWDGVRRTNGGMEVEAWYRDTNLRQAFKDSTIWFYQILARKVGHVRMQKFVRQAGYGNQQIGTEEQVDKFWLDGPLQTTAKQQIEFLQKVYSEKLPFSTRNLKLLKDIMIIEQTPNYILRGKTGWATNQNPHLGWLVGYLEQNNKVYFFATNIDLTSPKLAKSRLEVTRRCFKLLGLL
jgi:beta-lactamase class D